MFTTSTPTSTEVVQSLSSPRSPPKMSRNGSNQNLDDRPCDDDDFASFMPEFSLIEQRTHIDEEGLSPTTGSRHNQDILGHSGGARTKTCMPGGFFWRAKGSRKVVAQDIASVAASDTMISLCSKVRMSGRDLHEAAKALNNAGEYARSIEFFDQLREAQLQRFGQMHPSVGAAIHNVAVVHLRMGSHAKAEKLFAEAVMIRKETLGDDQLEVAVSSSNSWVLFGHFLVVYSNFSISR